MFQHSAARRRLFQAVGLLLRVGCFNTQPPEGGWHPACQHPTPKQFQHSAARRRLLRFRLRFLQMVGFNTQPPEGGCRDKGKHIQRDYVSTLSRPKAADPYDMEIL